WPRRGGRRAAGSTTAGPGRPRRRRWFACSCRSPCCRVSESERGAALGTGGGGGRGVVLRGAAGPAVLAGHVLVLRLALGHRLGDAVGVARRVGGDVRGALGLVLLAQRGDELLGERSEERVEGERVDRGGRGGGRRGLG